MDERQYSFLNRDLSWLSFNHRVLMEAADETVPLGGVPANDRLP